MCDSYCGHWVRTRAPLRGQYAQMGACLVPLNSTEVGGTHHRDVVSAENMSDDRALILIDCQLGFNDPYAQASGGSGTTRTLRPMHRQYLPTGGHGAGESSMSDTPHWSRIARSERKSPASPSSNGPNRWRMRSRSSSTSTAASSVLVLRIYYMPKATMVWSCSD